MNFGFHKREILDQLSKYKIFMEDPTSSFPDERVTN